MSHHSLCSLHPEELRLENTQESLHAGIPGSGSETGGEVLEGLGSNILVFYSVGPIITIHGRITAKDYVDRLGNQVHPMIQTMQFSKTRMPPFTQLELISHCWNSMKVNFKIFPGHHHHQI
jgi:hypothetical protein